MKTRHVFWRNIAFAVKVWYNREKANLRKGMKWLRV